jgi:hypothetical protein
MKKTHTTFKPSKLILAAIVALVVEGLAPGLASVASAAAPPQFTQAFLRLDRLKALEDTGGTVCLTPSTTGVEDEFQILFPTQTGTDFVVDATAANWTVTTTNLPAGATAWPGIGTATNVTGKTVTFPSGDLTISTQYCFNFSATNTLTNGSAGNSLTGTMRTLNSSAVLIEETNYAVSIIADDQIVVSAVVPPTFVFQLSGNTDAFSANLDPTVIRSTAGRTVTITTNAKGGWIGWVKDSQQGLFSATANYTIPTSGTVNGAPTTLTTNSEGYVLDADVTTDAGGGCTVAADAEYNGATTSAGGTLSANFQPFAACTGTPPATANGDVITLIERASIAGGTPAGSDYTDIITVVAAGNF